MCIRDRDTEGGNTQATFTPDIDITRWHHYAGTYDGTTVRLYIDGEEVASGPMTGPINLDSGPLFLGRDDGSNRFFDGQIDEVTIWNTARTPEEIDRTASRSSPGRNRDSSRTGISTMAPIPRLIAAPMASTPSCSNPRRT